MIILLLHVGYSRLALVAHNVTVRCSNLTRRVCKCYFKGRDAILLRENHDHSKCDCSSEDFTKPTLSLGNWMKMLKMGSEYELQQKESITLESSQQIIIILATQLERITAKVSGFCLQHLVVKDLSFVDCKCFISKWSKELKCLKLKNKDKVSSAESFRNCSEELNICKLFKGKTLTEDQKYLLWWIHVLQSFPKSSVCQDGCSRVELLNLYSQWKKGQLINVFPIIDFIMRKLLT
ncbi:uncharacterized protein zgc:113314 isoform X2 [Triplophysa dalaica]|uniref:uncharacterized protein zgc:113314 isoform X2 n=1 Tax=Triplophysa dalaica TaxID=1582913 RepID=UPI0024E02DDC|nr:uncharacterized protein zgc:113314 isoform X2 [Triplophysa dalaica]